MGYHIEKHKDNTNDIIATLGLIIVWSHFGIIHAHSLNIAELDS
jgi:hypothetical protein